jgi:ketosteroid isomerase-like protein
VLLAKGREGSGQQRIRINSATGQLRIMEWRRAIGDSAVRRQVSRSRTGDQQMRKIIVLMTCMCVCVGVVLAVPPQPSKDPAAVSAIKQIEQDMGDAMVRADMDKLGEIYADDFATVASSGKIVTKKDLLSNFESFHDKLESFENGPINVQVFGNVAVAQGTVTEKRTRDGKDVSGDFVWMDLLEKHAGKWVVLRSAGARVK